MSRAVKKTACPECRKNGRDKTGDNLVVYEDSSAYCFSCSYVVHSEQFNIEKEEIIETMGYWSEAHNEQIKSKTTFSSNDFRGIRDETYKYFGVRHEYDDEGQLIKQYYPATTNYELSGYKIRILPKKFDAVGTVGNSNDLFGQFRFKNSTGKYCLLVAGEIDQLSAFQMLRDYQKNAGKDEYGEIPVVSPSTGETGSGKQIQRNYEWFNRFDKIIVCYDNDPAGKEATDKLFKILPKGKMFVMDLNLKDTNEYLVQGKQKEYIGCFFKARKYAPEGIIGSDTLYDKVIEHALLEKIPLPPFLKNLIEMTAGGIPLGRIVNLVAGSGSGKTTLVNECIHYWVFNSPHLVGVVSLELDSGEYGEVILSRHIHKKLALIASPTEKVEFLRRQEVKEAADVLFKTENGNPRWLLVDDREGTVESLQRTVEQLIVECECKVIVLDPLQDILDGLSNEEQSVFMKWQKSMVKSHKVTFININHIRKAGVGDKSASEGAFITEEDIAGSSSIFKSAAANILFTRDKYADDIIERNTLKCVVSKIRWTGKTGNAGEIYYDNETHTLHDKEEYLATHDVSGF